MKLLHFIPAFVFLIITIILLCLPGTNGFPGSWWFRKIPQFDKIVHIGMFGMLCFLFHLPAWKSSLQNSSRQRWFWMISFFAIAYGVGMEFIQRELIAGRSFEEADILADAVGALGALALSQTLFLQRKTHKA
ncbi:VanZ family protein [Sediminibacterium goheungense]|uniref:VanZ like family protein n=1 Tax=Sediminibacterium goheungense TaxID=1086393 RepID=A0A4R6IVR1_9BACT|nr:VanZ family protein [Sediminibacterium goheungense]TDO26437.1 VanZ like family protein [Sediminibacterium goheungense]